MAKATLPPDMILAYKGYKEDTEMVAGWLAGISKQTGYTHKIEHGPPNKEPKLRGRARKLARDAAKQSPASAKKKYDFTVTTAEFVEMAKHIASVRPPVVLNTAMQAIWQRVIKMRRQFGDWFTAQAKHVRDATSDEKHSHFVTILEQALDILKPCCEPTTTKKTSRSNKSKDSEIERSLKEINNIFASLEVEDTMPEIEQQDIRPADAHLVAARAKATRARIEFDEQEAEDEFFFAIWSFMQDVVAVRLHVATLWRLYSEGKVDLLQAASVTNLAVDLVRRAEGDFEASLQRPAKYPAYKYPIGSLPFLVFKLHLPEQDPSIMVYDLDSSDRIVICGCETCDFLLYIPWAMARRYVEILKRDPPTFPTAKNSMLVNVPPMDEISVFRSWLYHAQNPSQRAQTEMSEILPTSALLSLMLRKEFIEDEILHAARHILENHTVPVWVSLAFQIQLDIQRLHTLHPINAMQDLRQSFKLSKRRCKQHQKWYKSLDFELWEKSSEEHVGRIVSEFGNWIDGGNVGRSDGPELQRRLDEGASNEEALKKTKRVPLLEYFPLSCGTLKIEISLEFHLLGLKLLNSTCHVSMLCHLYNAVRNIDPDCPIWPDMEFLIRCQGADKIFVGNRPGTLEDARKRLYLALGMSITSLAKDSKGDNFKKASARWRKLSHAPIAQNLLDRWMGKETRRIDEAAYDLQRLLHSQDYQRRLHKDLHMYTASYFNPGRPELIPSKSKMVQTLTLLSDALSAEMPAIAFDYFSFERQCYDMFLEVEAGVLEGLEPPRSGPSRNKCGGNPVSTTLSIVNSAMATENFVADMISNNHAMHRAMGPKMAKHMERSVNFETDEEKEYFRDTLKLIRDGGVGDFLTQYADTTAGMSAKNIFSPVRKAIDKVLASGAADRHIRKLRLVTGNTTYGVFLFSHVSLDELYGPNSRAHWEDIAVSDDAIVRATQATASDSTHFVNTTRFLHQKKVMCGLGEDSHAASGLKATRRLVPSSGNESEAEDDNDDFLLGPDTIDGAPVLQVFRELMRDTIRGLYDQFLRSRLTPTSSNHGNPPSENQRYAARVEDVTEDGDAQDSTGDEQSEEVKEDWDKFEGIYGRQGQYAVN